MLNFVITADLKCNIFLKNFYLITIVGPTAIGKTAMSIPIANHFHTEIISADSRQFFNEMSIGTAVPNKEELALAPHHFIQNKSIFDTYSVGHFEKEALAQLTTVFKKNKVVVCVGGSGLYVDALLNGLDEFPDIEPNIRKKLKAELEKYGIEFLQHKLKNLDLKTYENIALENPHRVLRALEICEGTGKPYSFFISNQKKSRNFIPIKIGLQAERSIIYDRINKRVDLMMEQGLLNEVKSLIKQQHLNALQTVGYKELFAYLANECTLEDAVEEIKKNTRRFAKRQLTWFKRDPSIKWFDWQTPVQELITYLTDTIEQYENND